MRRPSGCQAFLGNGFSKDGTGGAKLGGLSGRGQRIGPARSVPKSLPAATTTCPTANFLPAASEKAGIIRENGDGEKNPPFGFDTPPNTVYLWGVRGGEDLEFKQYKNDLFSGCSPPPKTHTSIAATWARGFPNRGPFSFLRPLLFYGERATRPCDGTARRASGRQPALVAETAKVASRGFSPKFQMLLELLPIPAPQHRE